MQLAVDYNTLFVGREHQHISEVDSTNAYAQKLIAKSNPSEGAVISTSYQTLGRGQIGRTWHSNRSQNILCSTILRPKFLVPKDQFQLNMAISCAIRAFVEDVLSKGLVTIKWPNDVYINHSKVAGLLIQNTISGSTISSAIIGLGININEKNFPTDLPNPTSLSMIKNRVFDIDHLYPTLFSYIEQYYLKLKAGHIDEIRSEYISHLYLKDKVGVYTLSDGSTISAILQHVQEDGKLVLLVDGKERYFSFRELRFPVNY